ncbi:eclosion hormone [Vanessa atalanta]|uniref:eclosion hormone n=1 Tax=Vanessa atalanta TaxID=42275 RepID=UPI001FCDF272|nr:eclosion hormone [Vanessa atalanta]XP_047531862.1 eclosion hormone [Vanessa atalanta]XP_047531863.1 eclosion hormone [Vanessa atalanta]XP_047531864.1 eclosion hormone [Vanessa atalanta]XP_047531865.1 eclosion hormone [Vanessa atalanta]XP_047531866.1 eclosion hormone [Vanessa atalanta]
MVGKLTNIYTLFSVAVFLCYLDHINTNPAIATGYDPFEICIENCAQCKKMLGAWFEGSLCAESCIKFKGKLIPECEDFASIAPFLNKL